MDDAIASKIAEVKRRIYALRNGVVADVLRRAGAPYRMVYGVNLPQLRSIAAETGSDCGLARRLWADAATRESVLLAPMVMPPDEFPIEEARQWLATAPSAEAVDVLCLCLLGHMPYVGQLADEAAAASSPLMRHAAMRLRAYADR